MAYKKINFEDTTPAYDPKYERRIRNIDKFD